LKYKGQLHETQLTDLAADIDYWAVSESKYTLQHNNLIWRRL